jgi:hypothetical protein
MQITAPPDGMLPATGYDATAPAARQRVSWSAILAGAVVVIAVEVLLSVLGAGVGLGLARPDAGSTSAAGIASGAGIWWVVSGVIALFLGSFVAARLAGLPSRFDGMLHGLIVWGLALLLTVYLLTSAVGGLIGGAFSALGGTLSAAGHGIAAAAPPVAQAAGLSPEALRTEAQNLLQSPGTDDPGSMSPQDAQSAIVRALPDLAAGGDRAKAAKDRVVSIMAAQLKIDRSEAERRFDAAQARVVAAKDKAIDEAKAAAQQGAAAASDASFMAFAALLIGAVAASLGGAVARPRRLDRGWR